MKKITFFFILLFGTLFNTLSQNFWQPVILPNPDMTVFTMATDNNDRLFVGSDDNIYYTVTLPARFHPLPQIPKSFLRYIILYHKKVKIIGNYLLFVLVITILALTSPPCVPLSNISD